ncbi:hypothetical protein FQZ97_735490 [compost metagenome]
MADLDQLEGVLYRLCTAIDELKNQLREREQIARHEILSGDELAALIGVRSALKQIEWLNSHRWKYELNAAGKPVVGRIYTRQRFGGREPTTTPPAAKPWFFDPSKVK